MLKLVPFGISHVFPCVERTCGDSREPKPVVAMRRSPSVQAKTTRTSRRVGRAFDLADSLLEWHSVIRFGFCLVVGPDAFPLLDIFREAFPWVD